MPDLHIPSRPLRVVTAAALFDGHDAAINIMRRILQGQGAEVIHLGHNRSVDEVAVAAIHEDADAVAISSYQGGHIEFFEYLVRTLAERGAGHVRVYGGGGGTIVAEEIERLHAAGVARIFSPEDGQQLGLAAMVNTILRETDADTNSGAQRGPVPTIDALASGEIGALSRWLSRIEAGAVSTDELSDLRRLAAKGVTLGITGTGGAGKSSLTDELISRLRLDQSDKLRTAVLAIDPSRRRGGGALLGDRIRMNCLGDDRVFFRSLATRGSSSEVPDYLPAMITACKVAGFDLVVVETPGIGQGDAAIYELVDLSLYVMTAEFGAASQLEKIEMLDVADVVAINKFERRGSEDARRDVARQLVRNKQVFGRSWEDMPVFGTSAASFNDDGVTALYQYLRDELAGHGLATSDGQLAPVAVKTSTGAWTAVPADRVRYLSEVADTIRGYHARTARDCELAGQAEMHDRAVTALNGRGRDGEVLASSSVAATKDVLATLADEAHAAMDPASVELLETWPQVRETYQGDDPALRRQTLSGSAVSRVALPRYTGAGDLLRFLRAENLPGHFPFTAGVFPFKREGEDPARM
ncbi:MAG TPA: cobalamin-dependent protein, partial [Jatrophihabitans sp.]